jgi:hypothetical protein
MIIHDDKVGACDDESQACKAKLLDGIRQRPVFSDISNDMALHLYYRRHFEQNRRFFGAALK